MKHKILTAVVMNARGNLQKHKLNAEILLDRQSEVCESDYIKLIEKELEQIKKYSDQLEVVDRYFEVKF
ncbi:MAG: hypothetical protein CBD16_07800 [Betaproteobacteria bacterium TMED156]|nr:MAG: hypothetical protein CBD16_07800 [Betaproteobacteria bacterium TMED156]